MQLIYLAETTIIRYFLIMFLQNIFREFTFSYSGNVLIYLQKKEVSLWSASLRYY